jgi:predicted  nucleic acid-binding Zn-ribbon protein
MRCSTTHDRKVLTREDFRMGPTNVALVKLYQADQQLREAQGRLDAATKNVRVQERRTNDLSARIQQAAQALREQQSKAANQELDLKSRDAHIEKLRTQQQNAKNNKEYQAFLIEINTAKVDKGKVEDETMKTMEIVERSSAELKELTAQLEGEKAKLAQMQSDIGAKVQQLQGEIDALRPAREEAAKAVPPKALAAFNRLADHHDGEAMSAITKPDRRLEEYTCGACMMDLVRDVYNKLHVRDDLVFCPSCRRILYIPDDLPPELAIKSRPKKKEAAEVGAAGNGGSASEAQTTSPDAGADAQ